MTTRYGLNAWLFPMRRSRIYDEESKCSKELNSLLSLSMPVLKSQTLCICVLGCGSLDVGCIHLRDMNPLFTPFALTIKRIFGSYFLLALDGKIKAWLYDCLGSRVDYDAPGLWCTTMAYKDL
ncbi:hypothetical protein Scep_017493 [Stephania cephalantha]|uniref:Uncharacterized protein n=1 Tax=Stephania cephalantha TaxID=152367 RepID=A0AAP0IQK0_9MAGN